MSSSLDNGSFSSPSAHQISTDGISSTSGRRTRAFTPTFNHTITSSPASASYIERSLKDLDGVIAKRKAELADLKKSNLSRSSHTSSVEKLRNSTTTTTNESRSRSTIPRLATSAPALTGRLPQASAVNQTTSTLGYYAQLANRTIEAPITHHISANSVNSGQSRLALKDSSRKTVDDLLRSSRIRSLLPRAHTSSRVDEDNLIPRTYHHTASDPMSVNHHHYEVVSPEYSRRTVAPSRDLVSLPCKAATDHIDHETQTNNYTAADMSDVEVMDGEDSLENIVEDTPVPGCEPRTDNVMTGNSLNHHLNDHHADQTVDDDCLIVKSKEVVGTDARDKHVKDTDQMSCRSTMTSPPATARNNRYAAVSNSAHSSPEQQTTAGIAASSEHTHTPAASASVAGHEIFATPISAGPITSSTTSSHRGSEQSNVGGSAVSSSDRDRRGRSADRRSHQLYDSPPLSLSPPLTVTVISPACGAVETNGVSAWDRAASVAAAETALLLQESVQKAVEQASLLVKMSQKVEELEQDIRQKSLQLTTAQDQILLLQDHRRSAADESASMQEELHFLRHQLQTKAGHAAQLDAELRTARQSELEFVQLVKSLKERHVQEQTAWQLQRDQACNQAEQLQQQMVSIRSQRQVDKDQLQLLQQSVSHLTEQLTLAESSRDEARQEVLASQALVDKYESTTLAIQDAFADRDDKIAELNNEIVDYQQYADGVDQHIEQRNAREQLLIKTVKSLVHMIQARVQRQSLRRYFGLIRTEAMNIRIKRSKQEAQDLQAQLNSAGEADRVQAPSPSNNVAQLILLALLQIIVWGLILLTYHSHFFNSTSVKSLNVCSKY